jgi:hypothetical protein
MRVQPASRPGMVADDSEPTKISRARVMPGATLSTPGTTIQLILSRGPRAPPSRSRVARLGPPKAFLVRVATRWG